MTKESGGECVFEMFRGGTLFKGGAVMTVFFSLWSFDSVSESKTIYFST